MFDWKSFYFKIKINFGLKLLSIGIDFKDKEGDPNMVLFGFAILIVNCWCLIVGFLLGYFL